MPALNFSDSALLMWQMRLLLLVLLVQAGVGCTRFDQLNAMVPSCGYRRKVDVAYGELGRQRLDVYVPRFGKKPAPVVVFFYGGAWQNGRKGDYKFVAEAMTSKGFIAVLPDYRLYPGATFPAFVEDGAKAVRWVKDHIGEFKGDPDRLYLLGHSAGAHTAAMLTLDERYLAAVGMSPQEIRATATLAVPAWLRPLSEPYSRIFETAEQEEWIEPHLFVDGHEPPMLLIHGHMDKWVAASNSRRLFEIIKSKDGRGRIVEYPRRGHAEVVLALAWPFRWLAPVRREVVQFFRNN